MCPQMQARILNTILINTAFFKDVLSFTKATATATATATTTATPQIKDLIGWMRQSNGAARVAHFLVQYFDDVCQTKTWNFHIWGSDANSSPQQNIFHSLPLDEKHLSQVRESTLRLVCTTWQTWNNRITNNLTQITFYFNMTFSLQQLS